MVAQRMQQQRLKLLLMMQLAVALHTPPLASQRPATSSSTAPAEFGVPQWAAKWQLRPAEGGLFEDLAVSQKLTTAAQPRAMRSTEAARLVRGGNFTPSALVGLVSSGSHGGVVWHRTRRSAGRFFANGNPGTARWPDRRSAGSLLRAERAVDTTPGEFFEARPNSSEFRYYTCPLQRLAPQLFKDGGVDQRKFGLNEAVGKDAVLEYEGGPLIRLSSSGSVCQCHWDSKHNVFVQLHGRKRFYLWPTRALPALRLHSSQHALYPKSMLNFDLNTPDDAALLKQRFKSEGGMDLASLTTSVVVDLEPGDVLYLPPMVPHHVECQGAPDTNGDETGGPWCIGFNVFSTGQFSIKLGAIQQQIHTDALGWFEPTPNAKPKREGDASRRWPQRPEFVLPMLQYVQTATLNWLDCRNNFLWQGTIVPVPCACAGRRIQPAPETLLVANSLARLIQVCIDRNERCSRS
jgi:hypothetical protein